MSNRIHNHAVGIRLNLEGALIQNNFLIDNAQGMDIRTSSNDIVVQSNTIINDAPQLIGAAMNLRMDLVDTDNGIAAYTWTQTAGPVVDLEDPHSPFGTFTAPIVGAATETIVFDLSVTDDDGLTDTRIGGNPRDRYQYTASGQGRGRPGCRDRHGGAAQRRGIL